MADKELRKMTRTELIEIIYALQQNERSLREENEDLRRQLDDRILRMEEAGSIAEASLSLNHVFEDAEAAARQYLDSLRNVHEAEEEILEAARQKAAEITAAAQAEADASADRVRQTEAECQELREQTNQEILRQRNAFLRWGQRILREHPEMSAQMHREAEKERTNLPAQEPERNVK